MTAAKRKWGQHWLASDALATDLVDLVDLRADDAVLEIGPGTGRMTRALLASGARVVAVEVDPECCVRLGGLVGVGELEVIGADVLAADDAIPWERGPFRVVGNLPYNVSSPILRWTVAHRESVRDAHYMLQAEVAERVEAGPGSRTYGLLSVLVQAAYEPRILQRLPPGAFRPPPRVDSAFLRLVPRDCAALPADLARWIPAAEAAFTHRRKTIRNALRLGGFPTEAVDSALDRVGIDPRARAEQLDVETFASLGRELAP